MAKKVAETTASVSVSVKKNTEADGFEFIFSEKPNKAVLTVIKYNGCHWNSQSSKWYCHYDNENKPTWLKVDGHKKYEYKAWNNWKTTAEAKKYVSNLLKMTEDEVLNVVYSIEEERGYPSTRPIEKPAKNSKPAKAQTKKSNPAPAPTTEELLAALLASNAELMNRIEALESKKSRKASK